MRLGNWIIDLWNWATNLYHRLVGGGNELGIEVQVPEVITPELGTPDLSFEEQLKIELLQEQYTSMLKSKEPTLGLPRQILDFRTHDLLSREIYDLNREETIAQTRIILDFENKDTEFSAIIRVEPSNLDQIDNILVQGGVSQYEKNGALLYAIDKGKIGIAELLINAGAEFSNRFPDKMMKNMRKLLDYYVEKLVSVTKRANLREQELDESIKRLFKKLGEIQLKYSYRVGETMSIVDEIIMINEAIQYNYVRRVETAKLCIRRFSDGRKHLPVEEKILSASNLLLRKSVSPLTLKRSIEHEQQSIDLIKSM